MNISNEDDNYFEIKKIEIDKFERESKKQKAFLLRSDISLAVMSVLTSTVFGIKGYNPFLAFVELFTLPIGMVVLGNIKTLLILKKKKEEIFKEIDSMEEIPKNIGRSK